MPVQFITGKEIHKLKKIRVWNTLYGIITFRLQRSQVLACSAHMGEIPNTVKKIFHMHTMYLKRLTAAWNLTALATQNIEDCGTMGRTE